MTIAVYRLIKAKHLDSAFNGAASKRFGGRWNLKGHACVYCAGSASLAFLEVLVHTLNARQLKNYQLYQALLHANEIKSINAEGISTNWRDAPSPYTVQSIGSKWLQSQSTLALRIPSAVIPIDHNILINPAHRDFGKVKFTRVSFALDPRMGLIGT